MILKSENFEINLIMICGIFFSAIKQNTKFDVIPRVPSTTKVKFSSSWSNVWFSDNRSYNSTVD